jgi:hypothetical protein
MMKNFLLTLWYLPSNLWYKYKEWQYERKCIKHLGMKPQKVYLSKEDFDALQKRLNDPLPPEAIENLKRIMNRRAPWDDE